MKSDSLENLFDFLPKSKIKAGEGLREGKYPFYTSSENQSKYLNDYSYEPGCLVFGTGGKASAHFTISPFSTSTDCITIKPKPSINIDAGYVFQYFKGNMHVLENGFKGAGLKHISKDYLSDLKIPHPEEVDDQIRIAHLLGKVEGLIAQRKQHLQQLDELLKSVFLEMFGNPVRNVHSFPVGKIKTVTTAIKDGPHVSPKYSEVGIPIFSTRNIRPGALVLDEVKYVSPEMYADLVRRFKPAYGDVLLTKGGTTGYAKAVDFRHAFCVWVHIAVLRPNNRVIPIYLEHALNSNHGYWQSQNLTKGIANRDLGLKRIAEIGIVIPPLDLQNQFAGIVQKTEAIKSRYQQSLTELGNLYGTLSQKAFKGELDLSRVPLPSIKYEEEKVVVEEPLAALAEHDIAINLPDTENVLDALENSDAREVLIGQWLESYRGQLGNTPFSVQNFMAVAQNRLTELHPETDFELGAKDYEHIKAWVFEALATNKLKQSVDEAGNRIQLVAEQ